MTLSAQFFSSINLHLFFGNLELFYIYITENEEIYSLFQISMHRIKEKKDEHPYIRPTDRLTVKLISGLNKQNCSARADV